MSGDAVEILLVEDNPGDVRLIEEAFARTSQETSLHVIRTGDEAQEFVRHRGSYRDAPDPDVVLLDWNLPTMNGGSVLEAIEDELQHVPVVVMTGIEPVNVAGNSLPSEPDAIITKPEDPHEYVEVIRSVTDDR